MTPSSQLEALQQQLSDSFSAELKAGTAEALAKQLAEVINYLILNDMNRLWFILYRVDIAEDSVLKIMQENPVPVASQLLAETLISRQLQKIESRKNMGPASDIPEDEKW